MIFDIDANGLVHFSAKDKGTGKEQKITITGSSGLTEAEIQRMVKDAESHEADDKSRRESVEARNHLDNAIYQAEKLLNDNREKIPAAERAEVEREIESAKKVLETNKEANDAQSAGALKEAEERLKKSLYKIGEMMYRQAGGAPGEAGPVGATSGGGGGAAGAAGKKDDGVIDAEFTEDGK